MIGKSNKKRNAVIIAVVMFGIISCFGDVIYEGARSANGQYFNLLAINATTIGILYGIGEFIGYALRLVSGKISDKTGKHWTFIFIGYGLLIVVPLMGITTSIPILFTLFLLERIGKALRSPAKDTILSQVAENKIGTGLIFGIQEALDQLGAFIGPLVFTTVFLIRRQEDLESYQVGYKVLIFAFILVMLSVFIAYKKISKYDLIKDGETIDRENDKLTPIFWKYCCFSFLVTVGFVAYSIIGYHLKSKQILPDASITALYSGAMIIDAIIAVIIGKVYDIIKKNTGNKEAGLLSLVFIPVFSMFVPFLTLSNNTALIVIGFIVYGVILGAHETVMRSAIADLTSFKKRGTAYGIFNAIYGLAFFAGSSLMGILYDNVSVMAICIFTIIAEIFALIIFRNMKKQITKQSI